MSEEAAEEFRASLQPRQGFDPDERELVPGLPTSSDAHAMVRDLLHEIARTPSAGEGMQDAARRILDGRMTMTQLMEQGGFGGYHSEGSLADEEEGIVWR